MSLPLEGQTALVTGAIKGIGAATAEALASAGAHVILVARNAAKLEDVEQRIHENGGAATIAPLDLAEKDAIPKLAAAIAGRWDTLDIMVIAAAYLPNLAPVTQTDGKEFSKAMTINVMSTHALLASFDPLLKRSPHARVFGLTSSVGASPRAYWSAYASTKAAFDNLLESYAKEVEKISEVRVAIIDPGATRTDMRARAYPGEDPQTVKTPDVVGQRIAELAAEGFETGHRERIEAR